MRTTIGLLVLLGSWSAIAAGAAALPSVDDPAVLERVRALGHRCTALDVPVVDGASHAIPRLGRVTASSAGRRRSVRWRLAPGVRICGAYARRADRTVRFPRTSGRRGTWRDPYPGRRTSLRTDYVVLWVRRR